MRSGTGLISKETNLTLKRMKTKYQQQIMSLHGLEFIAIPEEKKQSLNICLPVLFL